MNTRNIKFPYLRTMGSCYHLTAWVKAGHAKLSAQQILSAQVFALLKINNNNNINLVQASALAYRSYYALSLGKGVLSLPRPLERPLQDISELLPESWIVRMHNLHKDTTFSKIHPHLHSEQKTTLKTPTAWHKWGETALVVQVLCQCCGITTRYHRSHSLPSSWPHYLLKDTHRIW